MLIKAAKSVNFQILKIPGTYCIAAQMLSFKFNLISKID